MAFYANVIVDISNDRVDRFFQYKIPPELYDVVHPGVQVEVPFGTRRMKGYVLEITDEPEIEESRIKEITAVIPNSVAIEQQMIELAVWIRQNYGATLNHALKTVMPVKQQKKQLTKRYIHLILEREEASKRLAQFQKKHSTARARLVEALLENSPLEYRLVTQRLHVTSNVIRTLQEQGIVQITSEITYRNPIKAREHKTYQLTLNEQQQQVVDCIAAQFDQPIQKPWLLHGVTGSGKTEVYMELIADMIDREKQAIMLIPEIALTYQTVMRFYQRFGERVSILNSRMSPAERYDQFERAKQGNIDIMIGPRSALFTPFQNLGIIIIDEEHEASYKSEGLPRYHAREVAIQRAKMTGATVVLGSATPAVESYYKAKTGAYQLLTMTQRVKKRALPICTVVDLRRELQEGNRSILSRGLQEQIEDRLAKKQQVMLFLNRRGLAGFVSCRACGHVIQCPHCDVSLSQHTGGRMICHYCGYEEPVPSICPSCGSRYISGFKAGTQKMVQVVQQRFPQARILRMDADTTRSKDSYEQILSAFANQEADILIGTQMIVKGHDFPNVTLVGVLAADMSLHSSDYRGPERTFQLLTQAAGRAGRGEIPGEVIIQTYQPQHYCIQAASKQNYDLFYEQEMIYRKLLRVPPVWNMLSVLCASPQEEAAEQAAVLLKKKLEQISIEKIQILGPAPAPVGRVKDIYKKVLNIKHPQYDRLVYCKEQLEQFYRERAEYKNVAVQFDFNPVNGF